MDPVAVRQKSTSETIKSNDKSKEKRIAEKTNDKIGS